MQALTLTLLSVGRHELPTGEACLPADVRALLRGDAVDAVSRSCKHQASDCTAACRTAIVLLASERCFAHLTRPQPSRQHGGLGAMQGVWYASYPASGLELIDARLDHATGEATLSGTKLTGNQFVGAGRVSWEATPTSCLVVSSAYAGCGEFECTRIFLRPGVYA